MFNVDIQQKQYKTYVLSDNSTQARAEVLPERGGIVTRWSIADQELLYLDEERLTDPSLTVRGGIPILFPICGNLPDNTYTHNGQTYTLKQHGFARNLPWEVSRTESIANASVTVVLASNAETLAVYPFEFQLEFTYILRGNCLELRQQVVNLGHEPMPFSLGLHPYFWAPNKRRLEFEIPANRFQDQRSGIMHDFLGGFDFGLDEVDVLFREPTASSSAVQDYSRNLQVQISYEDPYSMLVFWTLKGKDFYCLEPWTAGRNAINTGDRLTWLDPAARLSTNVRLMALSL